MNTINSVGRCAHLLSIRIVSHRFVWFGFFCEVALCRYIYTEHLILWCYGRTCMTMPLKQMQCVIGRIQRVRPRQAHTHTHGAQNERYT